ncbi:CaiB/BaiF CoA transferase family protein [Acuticoccus kandeliae]|uniref:CaiB/BaiF CoA transferase family protein n=1 Tax=Acuticoccus kandeliae TaxID=2073160 RepID=UPI000D3ED9F3|nr:CoA transferase [Acuticoccus kandeliae]
MRPLEGIRVLEMGQLIAGPFCGQLLADFGAEVVKIEPPGVGDSMRQWGRTDDKGHPLWWPVIGRNKKSLTLDLRKPEAQDVVRALAAECDIIVENFRVGRMEAWGLGYDALKAINPRIIMVRVTGFGQSGPYKERAGFAAVCEAMGGMRYIGGYPDRPPVRIGISIGDTLAGQSGFQGALLALHHREKSGEGQVVDASIYESVLSVMEGVIAEYDGGGHIRERSGSILPGIAPSNAYPTNDGNTTIVIGANQDSLFRRLTALMGQPELADDPRFKNHRARGENQTLIDDIIGAWSATKPAAWLMDALAEAGVPAGLTYTAREMLADPHFQARQSITRVEDEAIGPLAMQNVFPVLSETPGEIRHTGPKLGEHTEQILTDWLKYDQEKIGELRSNNII